MEVMSGWDPPLRCYFLSVFDKDGESIYDGLNEINPFTRGQDLETIKNDLINLQIDAPEGFWECVSKKEDGSTVIWF